MLGRRSVAMIRINEQLENNALAVMTRTRGYDRKSGPIVGDQETRHKRVRGSVPRLPSERASGVRGVKLSKSVDSPQSVQR